MQTVLNAKEVWKCFQLSEFEVLLLNWGDSINKMVPLLKRTKYIPTFYFLHTGTTFKRIKYAPYVQIVKHFNSI